MTFQHKDMTFGKVIRQTLKRFGNQTSIAGLGQAVQRKSFANKLYWFILFLIGTFLTIEGIIGTFHTYYQYHVDTNTKITQANTLRFPAVSFCNLNR